MPIGSSRMLKHYFLIVAKGSVSLTSRFFVVTIPQTKQGVRDFLFLQKWASETNNFWSIRNEEATDFINHIAESLQTLISLLPFKNISARCLVDFIKTYKDVPKTNQMTRQAGYLRKILYPSANFQRKNIVIHHAEAKQRNKPKSIKIADMGIKNQLEIDPSADGQFI